MADQTAAVLKKMTELRTRNNKATEDVGELRTTTRRTIERQPFCRTTTVGGLCAAQSHVSFEGENPLMKESWWETGRVYLWVLFYDVEFLIFRFFLKVLATTKSLH